MLLMYDMILFYLPVYFWNSHMSCFPVPILCPYSAPATSLAAPLVPGKQKMIQLPCPNGQSCHDLQHKNRPIPENIIWTYSKSSIMKFNLYYIDICWISMKFHPKVRFPPMSGKKCVLRVLRLQKVKTSSWIQQIQTSGSYFLRTEQKNKCNAIFRRISCSPVFTKIKTAVVSLRPPFWTMCCRLGPLKTWFICLQFLVGLPEFFHFLRRATRGHRGPGREKIIGK